MMDSVNIVVYSSELDSAGIKLLTTLESVITRDNITIVRTVENFCKTLYQPLSELAVAVIVVSSERELSDLLLLRERLVNIPLILILPDNRNENVKKGYGLRPKILSFSDSDFSDVKCVFEKIVQKAKYSIN